MAVDEYTEALAEASVQARIDFIRARGVPRQGLIRWRLTARRWVRAWQEAGARFPCPR